MHRPSPRLARTRPSRALPAAALLALSLGASALPALPAAAQESAPASRFTVTYSGVDAATQAAVERATAVLGASLASVVPVTVAVDRAPLPQGVLVTATPGTYAVRDPDGTYDPTDTLYPVALANALAGRDVDPGRPDVTVSLSSTAPFSTGAGAPAVGTYDLTSAVLHELVHAVGLTASLREEAGFGYWGVTGDPVGPTPVVYDRFLVNATSADAATSSPVLRRSIGTRELGEALEAPVYWDGPQARAALAGARPRLESGPAFLPGVSLVHLREADHPAGTPDALLTPDLALGETARTLGPITLGMLADTGWAVPALPGSRFTAVAPRRLLDTRTGLGQGGVKRTLGPGAVLDLQVAGEGTGVPLDATAVVLNVTAVAPSGATDVRVYPTPRTREAVPEVSNLNLVKGVTRANSVTVPVGLDGRVRIRNAAGTVSVLADLQGFYARDAASLFHPVDPVRLLDTRTTRARTLGPGQVLDLRVAGARGVPAGASAVVLGLTALGATAPTDVRVYPTPSGAAPVPVVSNLNLRRGGPVAGVAVVRVGADGSVRLRNSAGATAVLVDLQGWFDEASPGGLTFRPVTPQRVVDTRDLTPPKLPAGGFLDVALTGRAGVPESARAVVLTLTGIAATAGTDLRAYPSPAGAGRVPVVSNLNLVRGQTTADAVVVATGLQGRVRVRNQSGTTAVAVDTAGWFGP